MKVNKKSDEIVNKAIAIAETGNYSKAILLFKKACRKNSENIDAHINTVQCLIYLERYAEALPYIQQSDDILCDIEERPLPEKSRELFLKYRALMYIHMSMYLFSCERIEESLEYAQMALEIDPDRLDAQEMVAACIEEL